MNRSQALILALVFSLVLPATAQQKPWLKNTTTKSKIIIDNCFLSSENQPDIKISLEVVTPGIARGTLNYFGVPRYSFATGIGNGFGLQYFHLGKLQPNEPLGLIKEVVASGRLVTFVGNQVARGTPSEQRIQGEIKVLLPSLPMNFFYSLDSKRFDMDKESKAMLNAFEGFFKASDKCDSKIFMYAW